MALSSCDKCGQPHPGCHGHPHRRPKTAPFRPCKGTPVSGTNHCRTHGGKTTERQKAEGQRAIAERTALGEAGKLLGSMGGHRAEDADPLSTILEAVALSRAMMRAFTELVESLDVAARVEVHGTGQGAVLQVHSAGVVGPDRFGELTVHPYVEQLRIWTREAGDQAKRALDAGISERQMQIAETDGRRIAAGFRQFLGGLVDALVAAGLDAAVVQRTVAAQAPALLRKAMEDVYREEIEA